MALAAKSTKNIPINGDHLRRTTNDASDMLHHQDDSATVYLLKKLAAGIPYVTSVVWGMVQEFGIIEGMSIAEVGIATNTLLSSVISPYFHSVMNALEAMDEFGNLYPDVNCVKDDEVMPGRLDISDASSLEQNMDTNEAGNEAGLIFHSSDFDEDKNNQRLDYVITQVDISRMSLAASRDEDIESVNKLPETASYPEESISICSSHEEEEICSSHEEEEEEEEDVDEFLLRNAKIIEDYFDNNDVNDTQSQKNEDELNGFSQPSSFSWMLVPDDPKEDDMTRMSHSTQDIPQCISICKSKNCSDDTEYKNKQQLKSEIGKQDTEYFAQEHQGRQLPSWTFARLGNLLSATTNEK